MIPIQSSYFNRILPFMLLSLLTSNLYGKTDSLSAQVTSTGADDVAVYSCIYERMLSDTISPMNQGTRAERHYLLFSSQNEHLVGSDGFMNVLPVLLAGTGLTPKSFMGLLDAQKIGPGSFCSGAHGARIIQQTEIDSLFDLPGNSWEKFYQLYPGSGGYNLASRICYNQTHTYAICQVTEYHGPKSGIGYVYLTAKKGSGTWAIINRVVVSRS